MIDELKVIDAIRGLAAQRIPELKKIYTDGYNPRDTQRPCICIEAITTTRTAANKSLLHVEMHFTITVFAKMNAYDDASARALLALRQKVADLFRCGYLRVDGRALNVAASTGGKDWDEAYIDLQLEFNDDRGGSGDALPMMETIQVDITEKKG